MSWNTSAPNKKSSNPFDEDDITSEFLSSTSSYLAADRLPQSPQERAVSEAEQRRRDLLRQMREVEDRTLDSSKRSVGMLVESEKIGIETAQDISRQREQLENTETKLDEINSSLKDTQKNINGIKSVFSSLKQWWGKPKSPTDEKEKISSTSPSESKDPKITLNLSSAVQSSEFALNKSSNDSHPALRLRGYEEEEEDKLEDFRARSQKVNKQLDSDLDEMSLGLSRLSSLAKGLGTEIGDQNKMLDRIHDKALNADITLGSQNKQMQKILKK